MEQGWFWIKQEDTVYPAFCDGEKWHHKKHDGEHTVMGAIPNFLCPTGCKCTQNQDGTWNVNCG